MLLTGFILLLLGGTVPDYTAALMQQREARDQTFADPVRSPLATSAIALLDRPRMVFGSSNAADLVWKADGVAPQHLEVLRRGEQTFVKRLKGTVLDYPDKNPVLEKAWNVGDYYWAGPVLLVLQVHPVGPVIRVVDPEAEELKHFTGLVYFPVDPAFRVEGRVEVESEPQRVTILDTQGWKRPAWIYGRVHFELLGESQSLDVLLFDENPADNETVMLMFRDKTSGRETYPACRYLTVPFKVGASLWLDFNKAFNPSCAYGDGFACPLPRPGNQLSVAVRAGEKTYPRLKH